MCRCSEYRLVFVVSISWLLYVVGVTVYVIVHACALCQWPHPCRLFHESFLHEISILCQFAKVFSLESFPLDGIKILSNYFLGFKIDVFINM